MTSIEPFLRAISGESRSGRQWRLEISAEEHHLQSDGREVFYSVGGELQWKAGGQHCDVLLGVLFACGEPDWHTRVAWVPARF
ncbi:MAG: hypothetical protein R3F05_15735 [Planctomycetota bacterium]